MNVSKKRRLKRKTDYKARISLLRSGKPRIVFRKTNRYIIGQCVESKEAKDKVLAGKISKELLKYGWPKDAIGSLKSLPACYLTGYLLGKAVLDKDKSEGILDIGLTRNVKKSRIYAFLKGVIDSGVKIKSGKEIFPDEKRIRGEHMKKEINFDEIKQNIDKKFV
jgi:large subunit ribosomal protein L18